MLLSLDSREGKRQIGKATSQVSSEASPTRLGIIYNTSQKKSYQHDLTRKEVLVQEKVLISLPTLGHRTYRIYQPDSSR